MKDPERFKFLVAGLSEASDDDYKVSLMTSFLTLQAGYVALINAIICTPDSLDERLNIRKEFTSLKLPKVLQVSPAFCMVDSIQENSKSRDFGDRFRNPN